MNFDKLKEQWDEQSSDNIKINKDFENHNEANTIIDKVRKVMRKDFFFQLTSFPLLLLYPFIFDIATPLVWFVITCYFFIMIIPLRILFNFYRNSYKLEYNSLKNISWFYYNYKFSIEIFKVYSYIISILIVMFFGIVYMEKKTFLQFESLWQLYVYIISTLIIYALICIWMMKWWIKKLYAKPLEQIKQILEELEE